MRSYDLGTRFGLALAFLDGSLIAATASPRSLAGTSASESVGP
jgi:hypothetical protein